MNTDFDIELTVPEGVIVLERYLQEFPIALDIGKHDRSDDIVLVQRAVSTVGSIYFSGGKGNVQFYDATVLDRHAGKPEDVMRSISQVLQRANLTHRIARVIHELGTDEEIVSFVARA
ncbi:MAG: hypothetical protein JO002_10660 [Burkholderiaceae bacterium]|nr:hypothetical protein [Burkholderiaceae bacterium]